MNIFDFNVHLLEKPDQQKDFNITDFDFNVRLDQTVQSVLKKDFVGANLCILDSRALNYLTENKVKEISAQNIYLTILINPLAEEAPEQIRQASILGIRGIKFHPYSQDLTPDTYKRVREIVSLASDENMWIAICGSYGTSRVYEINAVELMIAISEVVKTPVILLHAGGKLILDAMSIAMEQDNVFLETSFSLPFWSGSSVEKDMAFSFKKLGAHRVLYGSDHPYVSFDQSQQTTYDFFERYNFNEQEVQQVFAKTARSIIGGVI